MSLEYLFLYRIKAPMTREKYRGRLAKFFDFIGLTDNSGMEDCVKNFTERGERIKLGNCNRCEACTNPRRKS